MATRTTTTTVTTKFSFPLPMSAEQFELNSAAVHESFYDDTSSAYESEKLFEKRFREEVKVFVEGEELIFFYLSQATETSEKKVRTLD